MLMLSVIASFPNQICYNLAKLLKVIKGVIASFPNQICYNFDVYH